MEVSNNNLKEIQAAGLNLLKLFVAACEKLDLRYYLMGGTLLGAARHQGFIPWDDDLDVLVDPANYQKLLQVIDQEIGENFYYQCFEKDQRYNITLPSMKFRLKGTYIKERNFLLNHGCEGDGIFLDVFIFEKISENRYVHYFHKSVAFALMLPIVFFDNIGLHPLALKRLLYRYAQWYGKKNQASAYAYLPLTWTFDSFNARIKASDMFPTIRVKFEQGYYPVAHNYDACLKAAYGANYMTPPPIEKRIAKHTRSINLHSDHA